MKQLGLSAPVYATEPVHRLGLLTMYDQYLSRKVIFFLVFNYFGAGRIDDYVANFSAQCQFPVVLIQ